MVGSSNWSVAVTSCGSGRQSGGCASLLQIPAQSKLKIKFLFLSPLATRKSDVFRVVMLPETYKGKPEIRINVVSQLESE